MKITAHTFVTMDGVMQGPGGPQEDVAGGFQHGGWVAPFFDDELGSVVDGWFSAGASLLLGHTTFDIFAAYWPQVTAADNLVARAINNHPKYVAASSPVDPGPWASTTTVLRDTISELRELKVRPGPDLQIHGSHGLLQTLHGQQIIDEYHVIVFPVVLGNGKKLFDNTTPATGFEISSRVSRDSGVVSQILRPAPLRSGEFVITDGEDVAVQL